MKFLSILLSALLLAFSFGSAGTQPAYALSDYSAIYSELADEYPELTDRMLNGDHPVTEGQIQAFLDDLSAEVSETDVLTERNFEEVMYEAFKIVLFEDGEIGLPVDEHFDFGMMLLTEFSEEVSYALDEGELSGDLADLSDFIKSILLEEETPAVGGGGSLAVEEAVEPEDDTTIALPAKSIKTAIETIDGRRIATITPNSAALLDILETVGTGVTIVVSAGAEADDIQTILSGDVISQMSKQDATLMVDSALGYYALPAVAMDMQKAALELGSPDASDLDVAIRMGAAPDADEAIRMIQSIDGSVMVMIPPVYFEIVISYQDKTITLERFSAYTERAVPVPDSLDAKKITTAVVIDENGGVQHIPTRIVSNKAGQRYAVFSSMTNSSYAVIFRERTFADSAKHWASADINGMAGRMILGGVSAQAFEPDRDITRAEFMAIVVRSLGLMRAGGGEDAFVDVANGSWYYDAVSIAKEYGITSGNGDGTFAPDSMITREEAMAMIARAAKIAGLDTEMSEVAAAAELSQMKDSAEVSGWARISAAVCIQSGIIVGDSGSIDPTDSITRAETAVIVNRMLSTSGLI